MSKAPAFQFYVKDWLSDTQLRMASPSTRGIWIDVLCYMWVAPEKGLVEFISIQKFAQMTGAADSEITLFVEEAKLLKFCDISVTANGIVTLCNRRMHRDENKRKNNRLRQKRFRESRKENEKVTPPSSTASPSAKKKSIKKEIKKFVKPNIKEISEYCRSRHNSISAEKFYNFYESKGWMVGRNKMKDWKAAVRTWELKNKEDGPEPDEDFSEERKQLHSIKSNLKTA
jgi:hypothetical protein